MPNQFHIRTSSIDKETVRARADELGYESVSAYIRALMRDDLREAGVFPR